MHTVVNVHLTVSAREPGETGAGVAPDADLSAPAPVLARVRVALVDLLVTQRSRPASRTVADEATDVVLAGSSGAGVVPALVHVSLAALAVPARLAPAVVVVDLVRALAVVKAGTAGTLVDVLLAQPASVTRLAVAPEAADLVDALAVVEARVRGTLVDVDLAVVAIGARLAVALVAVSIVRLFAGAVVLAGVDVANLDPTVAQWPSIARTALAGERVDAVDTDAILTDVIGTVVPVDFAATTRETFSAGAGEGVEGVVADAVVVARLGSAVVNVDLAVASTEALDAVTLVTRPHQVGADSVVLAGVGGAVVHVYFAVLPGEAWQGGKCYGDIHIICQISLTLTTENY